MSNAPLDIANAKFLNSLAIVAVNVGNNFMNECGSVDISIILSRLNQIDGRITQVNSKIDSQSSKLDAIAVAVDRAGAIIQQLLALLQQLFGIAQQILSNLGIVLTTLGTVADRISQLPQIIISALRDVLLALLRGIFGGGGNDSGKLDRMLALLEESLGLLRQIKASIEQINSGLGRIRQDISNVAGRIYEMLNYVKSLIDIKALLNKVYTAIEQVKGLVEQTYQMANNKLKDLDGLVKALFAHVTLSTAFIRPALALLQATLLGAIKSIGATQLVILRSIATIASNLIQLRAGLASINQRIARVQRTADEILRQLRRKGGGSTDLSEVLDLLRQLRRTTQTISSRVERVASMISQIFNYVKSLIDINRSVADVANKLEQQRQNLGEILDRLGEILKALKALDFEKITKLLAPDDFPITVPSTLISKSGAKELTEDIETYPALFAWQIKQFDALLGQWEIEIEIEDTDLTKPGDQKQMIKLPNLAEAVAEQVGLLMNLNVSMSALMNMTMRTLTEAGAAHKEAAIAHIYGRENAQFLGYEGKEVNVRIPMAFKPGEQELDKCLQNTQQTIRGWENTDKHDLNFYFHELLQSAAIIRAVYWKQIDPKGNVKEQIKKYIRDADLNSNSSEANDDFDEFLTKVETGFTGESGITDPNHPYGRDTIRRPRIRKLGGNNGSSN